jgi:hypothetical protein
MWGDGFRLYARAYASRLAKQVALNADAHALVAIPSDL